MLEAKIGMVVGEHIPGVSKVVFEFENPKCFGARKSREYGTLFP